VASVVTVVWGSEFYALVHLLLLHVRGADHKCKKQIRLPSFFFTLNPQLLAKVRNAAGNWQEWPSGIDKCAYICLWAWRSNLCFPICKIWWTPSIFAQRALKICKYGRTKVANPKQGTKVANPRQGIKSTSLCKRMTRCGQMLWRCISRGQNCSRSIFGFNPNQIVKRL
jgi:hypothetical protein